MRKMSPIIFFNLILLIFIIGGLFLVYFFININFKVLGIVIVSLITLFLFFLLYTINFGIPTSERTSKNIENRKNRLIYTENEVIIDNPTLQNKTIVDWNTIEAIFLLNKPPLDGEYHNFEYSIILNTESKVIKYEVQKWYNKIVFFSKIKKNALPILRINDYSNFDFHTFNNAIDKFLLNESKNSTNFLNLKFGNKVDINKFGNITKSNISNPIKTVGFYKIFDRENNLKDENLKTFREESKNN